MGAVAKHSLQISFDLAFLDYLTTTKIGKKIDTIVNLKGFKVLRRSFFSKVAVDYNNQFGKTSSSHDDGVLLTNVKGAI